MEDLDWSSGCEATSRSFLLVVILSEVTRGVHFLNLSS